MAEKFKATEDHLRCIKRVKMLREARGESQAVTARLIKMYPSSYSDIEAPAKKIYLETIIQLADHFDVTAGFLIAGERGDLNASQLKRVQRIFDL